MAQDFFEKQNIKTPIKMEQNKNNASDNRPVTERIKTFEDARRELGDSNPLVFHYDELTRTSQKVEEMPSASDIVAYLKLRIIVAALNEGWEPKFEDGERRWAPYFVLYTNKEMAEMSDEDKKNCRVVGWSFYNANAGGGVAFAHAGYASSNSFTSSGSRLAFRTEELAEYAGKQFIDIYCQMMGIDLEQTAETTIEFRRMVKPLVDWCEGRKDNRSIIVLTAEKPDEGDKDTPHKLEAAVLGNGECLVDSIVQTMGQDERVNSLFKKALFVQAIQNIIKKSDGKKKN